jgi:DNA-binding NarL/FixJ family response regulator
MARGGRCAGADGLHTGEASLGDEGYVGVAVHHAARIGAAALGGQILLSDTTGSLVQHELPVEGRLRDLGERRVAQMAAAGSSNKEIAQALFVTVKTVEMHLGRVYRKLQLESRGQLGAALAAPEPEIASATA